MTDKKLTDEEIIKRLERCVKRGNRNYDTDIVLDLIKRQQSEIENLKVENQSLRSAANSLKMHYEEAQAKIEEFMKETAVTTLIDDAVVYTPTLEDYNKFKKKFKFEAYKEFAERLKEFMHNKFKALDEYEFEYITERDIDNLVKEMVGEDNA